MPFYRVIQRLKQNGLIRAKRIPRDLPEYRGAQARYGLTVAGFEALSRTREFYEWWPDEVQTGEVEREQLELLLGWDC